MSIVSVRKFNGNVENYLAGGGETIHLSYDRQERMSRIKKLEKEKVINQAFVVNKNHRNGLEIHVVTEEAIIYIYNLKSKNLVTALIARPEQVKRLYHYCNMVAPNTIINKASIHLRNGENY